MNFNNLYKIGEEIYKMLLNETSAQFIVCPCSLGDTVNIAAYISSYKAFHGIDRVILIIKEQHEDPVSIFPCVDGYLTISSEQMWGLRVYILSEKLLNHSNVLYGHFDVTDWSFAHFTNKMLLNFVDEFKADILNIPFDSKADRITLPNIDMSKYEGSVLLLPHAQTLKLQSESFWNNLVVKMKEKGLDKIYSNIGNPEETVLPGTEPLSLKISELCCACRYFKKIIGVRSGIFDMLALLDEDVSFDVIYPDIISKISDKCEISSCRSFYFDLKNLNPKAQIRSFAYIAGGGIEEQLIDEILDNI